MEFLPDVAPADMPARYYDMPAGQLVDDATRRSRRVSIAITAGVVVLAGALGYMMFAVEREEGPKRRRAIEEGRRQLGRSNPRRRRRAA